jgi:hypothetical protein
MVIWELLSQDMFDDASRFDTGGRKEGFAALSVRLWTRRKKRATRETTVCCSPGHLMRDTRSYDIYWAMSVWYAHDVRR